MQSKSLRFSWLFQMAWRDSRRSRARLLLFMSSIILGVAALVAIQSFGDNLTRDINNQSKELLGADLMVRSNREFDEKAEAFLDSLGGETADERTFPSMVYFPKTEESRLVQVRALGGDFPFYGKMQTRPAEAGRSFRAGRKALIANNLLLQFDAHIGDTLRLGKVKFEIVGSISQVPGENGMQAMVSTPVYIPLADLEATGLIRRGSRVNYLRYFRFEEDRDLDEELTAQDSLLDVMGLRYDTAEERREELGAAFNDMTRFLNLVAFIALLLGCVGVASSVSVYVREKISSVAILRCLGASGREAFMIYLIQIVGMGLIGAIVGAFLGSQIQLLLPYVLESFLPFEATVKISWPALLKGVLVGITIAVLFALLPLLGVRNISPLRALRSAFEKVRQRDWVQWSAILGIGLFIFGFSWWQVKAWEEALYFSLFIGFSFLLLLGTGSLIMWLAKRFFPTGWNFLWRQALSNLFRPQNQTLILMVSIGLGTGMIATLLFVQDMLLSRVEFTAEGDRPNMVLFDIQSPQNDPLYQLAQDFELDVQQRVPIVTTRLDSLQGVSRIELLNDSTYGISSGTLNREFRVTFRDSLIVSETLVEGKWEGNYRSGDSLFISVEEDYGKNRLKVDLGDEIVFDIQGEKVKAYVGSFRKIDWERVQTNFLVLFPLGVLEDKPQFHVMIGRTKSAQQASDFQRAVMRDYPNVSVMDLELILNTLELILDKISFVVRFMAFFSISTGFLVLIGSVIVSKYQRMQESVLLRTLGASRKQILAINALEYTFLGGLASGTGILLALIASWALAFFAFDLSFVPRLLPILEVFLGITALTVLIGLFNSREVINQPPLEVLRKEV